MKFLPGAIIQNDKNETLLVDGIDENGRYKIKKYDNGEIKHYSLAYAGNSYFDKKFKQIGKQRECLDLRFTDATFNEETTDTEIDKGSSGGWHEPATADEVAVNGDEIIIDIDEDWLTDPEYKLSIENFLKGKTSALIDVQIYVHQYDDMINAVLEIKPIESMLKNDKIRCKGKFELWCTGETYSQSSAGWHSEI